MKLRALHLAYVLGLSAAVTVPFAAARPALAQDADEEDEAVDDEEEALDEESARDADPSALTVYREDLAPHGSWVVDSTYGTVWVPNSAAVGADFAPYVTSGHWELTDDGDWLWVSDYSWGYIPFHYGRWVWTGGYGWAWIPGRVYSNAWVVWRVGAGGYIGWAPMAPSWYWYDGYPVVLYASPASAYVFCHGHHVFHHHVHRYVVRDRAEVQRAAASTRPQSRGRDYTPASPTLKQAGVDEKSAPKSRTRPDDKALKFDPKARRASSSSASGSSTSAKRVNAGTQDVAERGSGSSAKLGNAAGARATATSSGRSHSAERRNVRAGTRSLGESPAVTTKTARGDRSTRTRNDVADVPDTSRSNGPLSNGPRPSRSVPRDIGGAGQPKSSNPAPQPSSKGSTPPSSSRDGGSATKRAPRTDAPAPSSPPARSSSSSFGGNRGSFSGSAPRASQPSSPSAPVVKPVPRSQPKSSGGPRRGRR